MKERQEEIEPLRQKLDNLDWKIVRESERYYPLRFFADGLSAYVYVFDNAAVFYAWAAAEQALLIRLGPTRLGNAVANNRGRYPNEKKLVEIARDEGIISRDIKRLANRLRKVRNNHVHYINIMWDQHDGEIRLRDMARSTGPKIVKEILETVPYNKQAETLALFKLMKDEVESSHMIRKRQIPYIPGEPPNLEGKRFRNIRIKQFADWIKEVDDAREQQKRFDYGIERKDALDCLQWSADLLAYLNFLSE